MTENWACSSCVDPIAVRIYFYNILLTCKEKDISSALIHLHKIDRQVYLTAMVTSRFEQLLVNAGYAKVGTAPAQGNGIKAWWTHPIHQRVEVIYAADGLIVVTAYHVN